jgi:hypothetical protein
MKKKEQKDEWFGVEQITLLLPPDRIVRDVRLMLKAFHQGGWYVIDEINTMRHGELVWSLDLLSIPNIKLCWYVMERVGGRGQTQKTPKLKRRRKSCWVR